MTALAAPPRVRTFRDPDGAVIRDGERILRAVRASAVADFEKFLASRTAQQAVQSGHLVDTRKVQAPLEYSNGLGDVSWYEHERVWFPAFPYEWPAEMLHAAGALTLDLALRAHEEGFGIKDATPYNVLFRGTRPVFVDVLSFETRARNDATWLPYAQFVRTVLLPLLAAQRLRIPAHESLLTRRDGLEPEAVYRAAGLGRRLSPAFLSLVSIPVWLGGAKKQDTIEYRPRVAASGEQASYVLRNLLESCRKQLHRLAPCAGRDSVWTGYLDHKSLYSPQQLAQKEEFVRDALALVGPRTVLDSGANEGYFSALSARAGASVVAVDFDPAVVGSIWRKAADENLDVLPLVVDLAQPTPAMGWRNQEFPSFLDRARGQFDLVLMLALIHHLLVTERVPLDEIFDLASELSRGYVLIEFVGAEDPMFQRLVRGRQELYSHLTQNRFEAASRRRFELVRSEKIEGLHRWLYLFRRRSGANSGTC